MLLGMDAIRRLGGVCVSASGCVTVGGSVVASAVEPSLMLDDDDYSAQFVDGRWMLKWKWTEAGEPKLKNVVAQYKVDSAISLEFEAEVDEWTRLGWLLPYEDECDGIVPLMAVVQLNKGKVRPVMDYRELNESVSMFFILKRPQ